MSTNIKPEAVLNKIYQNPTWCWLSSEEKETLQKIASLDVLKNFITAEAANGWKGDPEDFVKRVSPLLPEALFEDTAAEFQTKLAHRIKTSEYFLETSTPPSPTIKATLLSGLDSLVLVIDTLIATFGVADFLKPIQGAEAQSKIFKLFILISLASALASLVSPIGAGIFLLAIVVISLIWASIKPTPSELPNAINWTKEARNGGYLPPGREDAVNNIAEILATESHHALVIGPSRSGKTFVAQELALRVEQGEFPELAGKTFFYINAATLLREANMVTGKDPISELDAAMGTKFKNCILVVDEAHALGQVEGPVTELLKSYLDRRGHFAHVIAITTKNEYEEHLKDNTAFRNRFGTEQEIVKIQDTDPEDTKTILNDILIRSDAKPFCSAEMVDYLYEVSENHGPQPYTAIQLLDSCIQRTKTTQVHSTASKAAKTNNKKRHQYSRGALGFRKTKNTTQELQKLEQESLADQPQDNRQEISELFQEKRTFDLLTKKIHQDTSKMGTTPKTSQIIQSTLLDEYIMPEMQQHLIDRAKELKVQIEIDKDLIDAAAAAAYPNES